MTLPKLKIRDGKPISPRPKTRFGLVDGGLWWNGYGFKDSEPLVTFARFPTVMAERKKAGRGEIRKVTTKPKQK